MELVKHKSKRLNKSGKPYEDLYLTWEHSNRRYLVRVNASFVKDMKVLFAAAKEITSFKDL